MNESRRVAKFGPRARFCFSRRGHNHCTPVSTRVRSDPDIKMTDETHAEGGAANTPPFPRYSRADSPTGRGDTEEAAASPVDFRSDEETVGYGTAGDASRRQDANEEAPLPPPHRPERKGANRLGEEFLKRGERTLYHGLGHIADQLEDAAQRIEHLADDRLAALGPKLGRAAGAAQSTSSWLTGAADYLRSADLEGLQRDLERQLRDKPLQTLLASAGAGWLLGKIIR